MIGSIARSASRCPFYNLALDEVFLKHTEASVRKGVARTGLLGYYNTPSVVVGRYQNQYMESNVGDMEARGIELVRRRSGGGTVYHDLGCLCFSIVTPRAAYEPQRSIEVVAQSLRDVGVSDVAVGKRHDLWIGDDKICGSAFRLNNEAAYHHGTLLFETRLSELKGILQPNPHTTAHMKGKSVASVRSPVVNISDLYPNTAKLRYLHSEQGSTDFFDSLEKNWASEYSVSEVETFDFQNHDTDINKIARELRMLVVDGTPKFTHQFGGEGHQFTLKVSVSHGKIATAEMPHLVFQGQEMPCLADCISNVLDYDQRFTRSEILKALDLAVIGLNFSEASDYEFENADDCIEGIKEVLLQQGL
eukprot:TRINITY_DN9932_c0_g1_i2.p1 TRINITY_DN9932_c0_g1~~TRINITY_DN9932_c0_g1_i2.p1  ORF type:complete len:362 (+),score=48.20 TRINITY_DN9932_c0_g1_i2:91-1176(+)